MNKLDEQWLTGFFEGDGCAYVGKTTRGIVFVQKERAILEHIQSLLGVGYLKRVENPPYYSHRLGIYGKENYRELVELFGRYVVSNHSVMRLRRLADAIGLTGIRLRKHKPTMAWVVGLWDAEGSSTANHRWFHKYPSGVIETFGMKDKRLLEEVQLLIGGCFSRNGTCWNLRIGSIESRAFILQIFKHSRHETKRQKLIDDVGAIAGRMKHRLVWWRFYNDVISKETALIKGGDQH